ncbi:hypothetical protein [Nocardia altamirensis]|uniref:hypothetical protein n=1 Tax=Nocardia altamirensis TaxID=472158 RepID=UPI00084078B6|nr:hypothetical protein [Nocardia altamirensis]
MDADDYEKLATPAEKQTWAKQNNLMYGGLIAVGVVILQGFLTAAPLDVSGMISVVAFAIALPLLAVLIMLGELHKADSGPGPNLTDEVAKGVALLASMTGVVAAFWHIDWLAGVVVLLAGAAGRGVYGAHFNAAAFNRTVLRRRQRTANTETGGTATP